MSPNWAETFYRHIAQTSDSPAGLVIDKARGSLLHTEDGQSFVDFISGIAVSSLGHAHPEVVASVQQQAASHMHVMVYGEYIQKPQSRFAGLLMEHLPDQLDRVYFVNSGTEANEGALKLAKKYTGRSEFVSFHHSYHGDTHGSLSVTGREVYRTPYEPLLPGVTFAGFNEESALDYITESTAAVILEPIQGEGGIIQAESAWLQKLRQRCNEKGALLIFDEIQSGFGRTGKLFAFEHYGIIPDILTMAKAMGGGMPMGGFAASGEIFEVFKKDPPLNHVTTFGGHPVSAAAAHAALNVLLRDGWMERAPVIEQTARELLKSSKVNDLRGKGAMLGLQLKSKKQTQKVVEACLDKGIILGWTLHSDTLIRLAPPLTIDQSILEESLKTITEEVDKSEV